MSRKDIKEHDRVLIEHKLYEMKLNKNMIHTEAHSIATRKYGYQKGVDEYYGNIGKNKKTNNIISAEYFPEDSRQDIGTFIYDIENMKLLSINIVKEIAKLT